MAINPYEAPVETPPLHAGPVDRRWLAAIPFVAVVIMFVTLPLMLTLLVLLACNVVTFVVMLIVRQTTAVRLAFLTGVLLVGCLVFTNWGFSMPEPRIIVSWIWLVPAIITQLALIACPFWLPFIRRVGG